MRGLGIASLLAGLAGVFAGPRVPVASTSDVIRFGFRQHAKRAVTAAEAKRQARKLRNVRARTAK